MCFCFIGTGVEAKRVGDFQVRGCSGGEGRGVGSPSGGRHFLLLRAWAGVLTPWAPVFSFVYTWWVMTELGSWGHGEALLRNANRTPGGVINCRCELLLLQNVVPHMFGELLSNTPRKVHRVYVTWTAQSAH